MARGPAQLAHIGDGRELENGGQVLISIIFKNKPTTIYIVAGLLRLCRRVSAPKALVEKR